jgi:hypothetical protein
MYTDVADELMRFYSDGDFKPEALRARKEFSDFVGVLDEDNPEDEMKFNLFADWYLYIRKIPEFKMTPLELQRSKGLCQLSEESSAAVQNLMDSRLSLFEFQKLKKQDVYLKDLFSGYKLMVKNSEVIHGFESGVPFSARLIPHEDTFSFTSAFCFHPGDALKYMKAEIKRVAKLPDADQVTGRVDLILMLLRMRHRFDHFKKVPLSEIYTNTSKLGI